VAEAPREIPPPPTEAEYVPHWESLTKQHQQWLVAFCVSIAAPPWAGEIPAAGELPALTPRTRQQFISAVVRRLALGEIEAPAARALLYAAQVSIQSEARGW
jgi:hypothetical protein